jgi:hypothetical protein
VAALLVACSRPSAAPLPGPASSSAGEHPETTETLDAASDAPVRGELDAPADAPTPAPPLPHVDVTNIGMHIGGGPNDAATKEPVARSVASHFDEFRRCYALVAPPRAGDFGIDLLIEAEGGLARADHPRTTLGDAFTACMTSAFAAIVFERPRTGRTKVSYSLRFVP